MSDAGAERLPVDSDAPRVGVRERALHLRPAVIGLVAAGGALGTAAREGLALVIPAPGGFPLPILLINLVGAFLLGALLDALARSGPDAGARRMARLGAGTGFCGGFTTYSSLATAAAVLLAGRDIGTAVVYGLASVVLGAGATLAGIAAGGRLVRGRA